MSTRLSRAGALCVTLGTLVWSACSDPLTAPPAPGARPPRPLFAAANAEDVRAVIAVQERHNLALLRIPGVVGTAVGLLPSGKAGIRVFVKTPDVRGVPPVLDNVPVAMEVTGLIVSRSDPTQRLRPAPVGYSVGHPLITAGTIGALVRNAALQLFVLSNNHVLANQNDALIGDAMLQPGPFDGGTATDRIGALAEFKPIDFSGGANRMDAAIALVTSATDVSNSTPTDDGYGVPNSKIFGDGDDADELFDDIAALLTLRVQKYGRTTKLTKGQITGINATLDVCYEAFLDIFCIKSARFTDQIIIDGAFSQGGDSGSLIVTDDANNHPVALLFAGNATTTIANRIDLVLSEFDVSVDGSGPPPPVDATDVAVTGVSVPAFVVQNATVNVAVTIRNVGAQNVASSFDVTLTDATTGTTIGTRTVSGLAPGATSTLNFSWNTTGAATGSHTLTASHGLVDDNVANNSASSSTTVNAPGGLDIHIGDLDAIPSNDGTTWSTVVEVTVHDGNHSPINGATIVGSWNVSGLNSDTCTTGDLGGNGTCIMLATGLRKKSVTFTVGSVTMTGKTYRSTANHDDDGTSSGTSIKVNRP